jgi:hypothetical protein
MGDVDGVNGAEVGSPPTISSPKVPVLGPDGKTRFVSRRLYEESAASPELSPKTPRFLYIFDSGWGGVIQAKALKDHGYDSIIHIKNNFSGFPKDELEEQLRGMPGGSHLEMETSIDGCDLIAVGYKYNSTKTLFFVASKGAAPTTEGEPYTTKFLDELRNVLERKVPRPALCSRYFANFNKVDVCDMRRQSELGLEIKWVPKGEHSGKFRLATTIFGQCAIDSMIGTVAETYEHHVLRSYTVKDFIEELAEEMVDNELNGSKSRPFAKRQSSPLYARKESPLVTHELKPIGHHNGVIVQRHCVYCGKKASTYCAFEPCRGACMCQSRKRNCFERHCGGEIPQRREMHTPKKFRGSLIEATPTPPKATPPAKKKRAGSEIREV